MIGPVVGSLMDKIVKGYFRKIKETPGLIVYRVETSERKIQGSLFLIRPYVAPDKIILEKKDEDVPELQVKDEKV